MKISLRAIAKLVTPVLMVAASLVAVQTPAYAASSNAIFLSFEPEDPLKSIAGGANGAFEGGSAEIKSSTRLRGNSLHFTKNGQAWSGVNLLLRDSTPFRYTDAEKTIITMDYWSNDTVPTPVMMKLEGSGSAVKTLEAQPGFNSLSFDMSTGTGWNANAEYKVVAVFPNFGVDDRTYTGAAKIPNSGQIYEIDNVSINGGQPSDVVLSEETSNVDQQFEAGSFINQVASGTSHACAIDRDKKVVCWGGNTSGQTSVPEDLGEVSQITVGGHFSCALKVTGDVKCWGGYSRWKQDYLQDINETLVPTINEPVTYISSDFWNSCAIGLSGKLYCWGGNQYGESPTGITGIKHVDVGFLTTCAVTFEDTLRCWGNNDSGQATVPSNLGAVKQVSTGVRTCVLTVLGEVKCWGRNWNGELSVPTDLGFVTQVSLGERNVCALNSQGIVKCWGDNGTGINTLPADLSQVKEISTSVWMSCAISEIGKVWCWGDGYDMAQAALVVPTFEPRNLPGANTGVAILRVNDVDVVNGQTLVLLPLTREVDVLVETIDLDASYEIYGDTNLVPGANTLTVIVEAADGSRQSYTVTLNVALNDDASLRVLTIGGVDVVDGEVIELASSVREVEVAAVATDAAASVQIDGATGLKAGANTLTVKVTAADGVTVQTYSLTLYVALSNDTSLSEFLINGKTVADGSVVDLGAFESAVSYSIRTRDVGATYTVTGYDNLVEGENLLSVTVTAADGTTKDYFVTLNVEYGRSIALSKLLINGVELKIGETIEVDAYTLEVAVDALTMDPLATYEVFGNSELVSGTNTVSVTVTSADQTRSQTFDFKVFVQRGFEVFVNNGEEEVLVEDGDVVDLAHGTREVAVKVLYNGQEFKNALVGGHQTLATGNNQMSVLATSPGGKDFEATVGLFVAYSTNTAVKTIRIDGQLVQEGATVELAHGTPAVDVVLELADVNATYDYSGDSGLLPGLNPLVITVKAQDDYTTRDVLVYLNVALNNDASVDSVKINGVDVFDGETFEIEAGTESVNVSVLPVDPQATFQVTGNTPLQKGSNEVSVTVTAADGNSTATYLFTVVVLPSADVSLAAFEVDGGLVSDGEVVVLAPLVTEVDVYVEPTDSDATFEVLGASGLEVGENRLVVSVLAADGVSSNEYVVVLVVPYNTDASATVFVDGAEVVDGETLTYVWGVDSVDVEVNVSDPEATYVVEGDTDLATGENVLSVVVTAADSTTTMEFNILIEVLKNTDTSLAEFTINGEAVEDGSEVALEPLTDSVEVVVVTTDDEASYILEGDTDLVVGLNELVLTVIAANGEILQDYIVTIVVAPNTDASLASFLIGGQEVSDGSEVLLPHATEEIDVEVLTRDPDASFEVFGGTELQTGDNRVLVVVTAADGETIQEYEVNLNVAMNSDTSLAAFEVDGGLVSDGEVVVLAPLVTEVDVYVEPTDSDATFEVLGASGLEVGENRLVVSVLAADGVSSNEYVVTLVVPYNTDASATVFVDGAEVVDGETLTYVWGVDSVDVEVNVSDPDATYVVEGDTDLATGENVLSIVVTAADSTTTMEFNILIEVLKNTDTSLAEFTINGEAVEDGSELELPVGTTYADLSIETTDPEASFEVEGGSDLALRDNLVVVTVTAANGYSMREYRVSLYVPPSTDSSISGIFVNGQPWEEGKPIEVDAGDIDLEVLTNNEFATFTVAGVLEEASGIQDLEVVVTAQDGIETSTFTVTVWASEEFGLTPVSPAEDTLRVGTLMRVVSDLEAKNPFYKASYTWMRNGEEIVAPKLKTYLPTAEDIGQEMRVLVTLTRKGTLTKTHLSKAFEIELGLIKNAPATSIKGTAVVGRTVELVPRTWPRGTTLSYQWNRDGVAIPGQTSTLYRISPQDVNSALSLSVTGALPGYESLEKVSPDYFVIPGVFKYTVKPRLVGGGSVGTTITVDPGAWPSFATVKLIWLRNGVPFRTSSGTDRSYTLTSEDYQQRFSIQVVAEALGYKDSVFSLSQVVKAGTWQGSAAVKVSGSAQLGQLVSAELANYPAGTMVRYFWYRDAVNIRAAVGSTYEITDRDLGRGISVKATISIPGYRVFSSISPTVVPTKQ